MPTSGDTNFEWTAGQIMLDAACELGAIEQGDTLEASEEEQMQRRLNGMLAKWSMEGNLFREAQAQITLAADVGSATLPASVRDIRAVRHIVSTTNRRDLFPLNRDQWLSYPNRAQSGNPIAFYYSQQTSGDQLYVWPVPSSSITLELDYSRAFEIISDPTQTLDLPPEWYEAVLYGLASRAANIFGATRIDPNTVNRIDTQASATYQRLLDADRPDSYRFEYDRPVEVY